VVAPMNRPRLTRTATARAMHLFMVSVISFPFVSGLLVGYSFCR
jgi:hypothetical protein